MTDIDPCLLHIYEYRADASMAMVRTGARWATRCTTCSRWYLVLPDSIGPDVSYPPTA